jgi:hypothetical protein
MAQGLYFEGSIDSAQVFNVRQCHRLCFALQEIAEATQTFASGACFRPDEVIILTTGDGSRPRQTQTALRYILGHHQQIAIDTP